MSERDRRSTGRGTDEIRAPEIDYLAKDYASFKRLMLDQLALHVPGWQERNASDLGNVLLEVLAYGADQLSYYQDAVATEAYLGTARRVASIKRHTRLLDYYLHPGCNSRVWVHIGVDGEIELPAGTSVLSQIRGLTDARIRPGSPELDWAMRQKPAYFQTMHAARLCRRLNKITFHAEAESGLLRRGATAAELWDDWLESPGGGRRKLDDLHVGDVLIFEEIRNPLTGRIAGADPRHRHAVRLTRIERKFHDEKSGGKLHPVVSIEWSIADALPFDLTIAPFREHGQHLDVAIARGNIVLADHGRTVAPEVLPEVQPNERYRPYLRHPQVTFRVPYDHAAALLGPATEAVKQRPWNALAAVCLKRLLAPVEPTSGLNLADVDGYTWLVQRDLLSSNRRGRHFLVETTGEQRAYLRFGFNEMGKLPQPGYRFAVQYRIGNGAAGNIGPDSLTAVVTDRPGIRRVRNPLPATGGIEPEDLEHARWNAPHAYRKPKRCVTAEDYALGAAEHPSVADAVAQIRWTGSRRTVFVHVRRVEGLPVDAAFCRELSEWLEPYRIAGAEFAVRPPHRVRIRIGLRVFVESDQFRESVGRAVAEAISSRGWYAGRPGFFHPGELHFGQDIHQSQLIRRLMSVRGVERVEVFRFGRRDGPALSETISIGALEIASLTFDPDRPDAADDIELFVEGGR